MRLVEIPADGRRAASVDDHELLHDVIEVTTALYDKVGFEPPWVGYVAADGRCPLGTCAFKSPPVDGRVEIAYFTLPEHEGRGIATRMAQALVELARNADASLTVVAQTLPEENASTSILRKLGFAFAGEVAHPEDGTVWEWHLGSGRPLSSIDPPADLI
ncbi:MAG: N-acetyltransferase [Planctomycetota bacterium]|nr:MAG: N-acetyltransferase [Planctomycetota bacterium]